MRDFFFFSVTPGGCDDRGTIAVIISYAQLREKGLGREETTVMGWTGRPATHRVFI